MNKEQIEAVVSVLKARDFNYWVTATQGALIQEATQILQKSIAQPVQPDDVQRVLTDAEIVRIHNRYGGNMVNCARAIERAVEAEVRKQIEAAQPVRLVKPVGTPLADAQLLAILAVLDSGTKRPPPGFRQFARAIEAAHGIKPASEGGA